MEKTHAEWLEAVDRRLGRTMKSISEANDAGHLDAAADLVRLVAGLQGLRYEMTGEWFGARLSSGKEKMH